MNFSFDKNINKIVEKVEADKRLKFILYLVQLLQ